jgi:hypothetical protein
LSPAAETRISIPERVTALALLASAVLLRVPYVLHYRFNSDESQHLHVVWGWTRGLIQYRDTLDNHAPLFHLAMAPLLALFGEHAWTLFAMRFAMLPLYLVSLALTFAIARRLFSDRVGLWAAVLLAVHFEFFFPSIEFRTDNLWTVAWLAALTVLVGGRLTAGRAFAFGLLLGTAAGVSQKTLLLAASLAAATALMLVLAPQTRRQLPLPRAVALVGAAAAGFLVVPLLLVAFFAAAAALDAFFYGAIQHNLLPGMGETRHVWRFLLFPAGLAVVLWLAAPLIRSADGDRLRSIRLLLALTAAIYYLSVQSFWPLVTAQDWLPFLPLLVIFVVAGFAAWAERRGDVSRPAAVLAALVVVELGVLVFQGPVWKDRTAPQAALVCETLRLTDPGDWIIDAKGETVFRRRALPWVLESITRERLRRGLIRDTLAEDAIAMRCWAATVEDERFSARARAFLAENYVPVGLLRVAGRVLGEPDPALHPLPFAVVIPGPYAVAAERGTVRGLLDGTPYEGPRELAAGRHEFVPGVPSGRLAVVWAQAVARGFSPFRQGGTAQ